MMSTNLSMMPVTTGVNPYAVHMGFFPTLIIALIALLLISRFVGKFFDIYKDIKEELEKTLPKCELKPPKLANSDVSSMRFLSGINLLRKIPRPRFLKNHEPKRAVVARKNSSLKEL